MCYILQRNKTFRAQLERNYRARALDSHLRSVPIFGPLTKDFIDHLRDRVELIRYQPGQVICRQGDPADSFYLMRIGLVKISEQRPGGEMILAYLGRGGFFGEIGLLSGGTRTASCTALDHVEVVRITGQDFQLMLDRFPDVRRSLQGVARGRVEGKRKDVQPGWEVPVDALLAP